MKNLIIAVALVATTTLSLADSQASWRNDRPYTPKPVICIEPDKPYEVQAQPPAYIVTLDVDGVPVEYLIDNQFAIDTGIRNLPRFYGTLFDAFVVRAVKDECEVDYGLPCVFLNVDEIAPGPRTDGVNRRPSGSKFD